MIAVDPGRLSLSTCARRWAPSVELAAEDFAAIAAIAARTGRRGLVAVDAFHGFAVLECRPRLLPRFVGRADAAGRLLSFDESAVASFEHAAAGLVTTYSDAHRELARRLAASVGALGHRHPEVALGLHVRPGLGLGSYLSRHTRELQLDVLLSAVDARRVADLLLGDLLVTAAGLRGGWHAARAAFVEVLADARRPAALSGAVRRSLAA